MKVKFGSWNLNRRVNISKHIALLEEEQCDIVALQGVKWKSLNDLMDAALFNSAWPSTEGVAFDPYGCAIVCKGPSQIRPSDQAASAPFGPRGAIAIIQHPTGRFVAGSFQVPHGTGGHRRDKLTFVQNVANWLRGREHRAIVGLSANTPKVDRPNHADNEWWSDEEASLLGDAADHGLRDVLREYYDVHPEKLRRIPSDGPLATSYIEAKDPAIRRRYDFILASLDCLKSISNVRYLAYRDTDGDGVPDLQPSQDHALVVAELDIE